ncbi:MAG: Unknown protein [uncultured Sulfurovum sp.]|uniref:Uncharacterized protein n=1 Tax=uncultured Sulfurovum sp. TaxID=269237 RepID=A0A6S6SIP6_9BACT|nr:MAG: Unknown protein [uncultured Sulfurovum sp.]
MRVTKNGFYPNYNFKIPVKPSLKKEFVANYYSSKISNYSGLRQFNLKKFIDDINNNNLRNIHEKILTLKKKYKYTNEINFFMPKDIIALASNNISEKKKKSIEEKCNIAIKKHNTLVYKKCREERSSIFKKEGYPIVYIGCYYPSPEPIREEDSYDSSYSGSGGGYSGSSSGCRVQTVYVPGGNGRTAQTTVCN